MPFVTSQRPIESVGLAQAILAALSTRPSAALLTTPTVHLFTALASPISPNTTVANFTEATFSGYAAVTQGTLLGPINLPGFDGYGVHAEADFLATAVVAPGQNILGYWVDNGASTFYYGETFPNPIPISNPGDYISLDVIWVQPVYMQAI